MAPLGLAATVAPITFPPPPSSLLRPPLSPVPSVPRPPTSTSPAPYKHVVPLPKFLQRTLTHGTVDKPRKSEHNAPPFRRSIFNVRILSGILRSSSLCLEGVQTRDRDETPGVEDALEGGRNWTRAADDDKPVTLFRRYNKPPKSRVPSPHAFFSPPSSPWSIRLVVRGPPKPVPASSSPFAHSRPSSTTSDVVLKKKTPNTLRALYSVIKVGRRRPTEVPDLEDLTDEAEADDIDDDHNGEVEMAWFMVRTFAVDPPPAFLHLQVPSDHNERELYHPFFHAHISHYHVPVAPLLSHPELALSSFSPDPSAHPNLSVLPLVEHDRWTCRSLVLGPPAHPHIGQDASVRRDVNPDLQVRRVCISPAFVELPPNACVLDVQVASREERNLFATQTPGPCAEAKVMVIDIEVQASSAGSYTRAQPGAFRAPLPAGAHNSLLSHFIKECEGRINMPHTKDVFKGEVVTWCWTRAYPEV
ncbi:hypothetical protein OF83DRAFT_1288431 [Amylostereum chailletii]|nr:hypothetical protein OF83DRAFT_1288431 [Amylostereum chailletii]